MKILSPLKPDETRTFCSPLSPRLVRTGVIGDGSCFFHAVALSLSSEYRHGDTQVRMKYVRKMRQQIIDYLTNDTWKQLGHGEIYNIQVIDQITELMRHHHSEEEILKCIQYFQNRNDDDINYDTIIQRAEQQALKYFIEHLQHAWADEFFFELASIVFDCQIFFVDASTRLPYKAFQVYPREKIVLICWTDWHYETLSELTDGTLKRIFTSQDEVIQNILKYYT